MNIAVKQLKILRKNFLGTTSESLPEYREVLQVTI